MPRIITCFIALLLASCMIGAPTKPTQSYIPKPGATVSIEIDPRFNVLNEPGQRDTTYSKCAKEQRDRVLSLLPMLYYKHLHALMVADGLDVRPMAEGEVSIEVRRHLSTSTYHGSVLMDSLQQIYVPGVGYVDKSRLHHREFMPFEKAARRLNPRMVAQYCERVWQNQRAAIERRADEHMRHEAIKVWQRIKANGYIVFNQM